MISPLSKVSQIQFLLFRMPGRSLEPVYVKCSMPAKVDLSTRLVQDETKSSLVVNPDTSRVISLIKHFK